MTKIKTSELTGVALRYAVALALKNEGYRPYHNYAGADGWSVVWGEFRFPDQRVWLRDWQIEQDQSQAGSIIDREHICTFHYVSDDEGQPCEPGWTAFIIFEKQQHGPTRLIAAWRCFVASRLGDEVEVPLELTDE